MDAARVGLGRAITDRTRDEGTAVGASRRLTQDREILRTIETLVPNNAQREALLDALRRENAMGQVERTVSPRAGSQTARLQAGQDDMAVDPPGAMMTALLMGRPESAIGQGISRLYRRTQGINSNTADALARRLMETDQAANAATVQRLMQQSQTDQMTAQQRAALASALLRSAGSSASMTVN